MNQIRHFLAVVEKGNFTRAAQLACISQPSLTQSIKKLEDELGGSLFLRDRAGCQLTALGRLLEPRLRQIYENTQSARREAMRFSELNKVPFRLGVMHTIGSGLLAKSLARFQAENPATELEVFIEHNDSLFAKLEVGDLDLVITSRALAGGSQFDYQALYSEDYYFVFGKQHPLDKFDSIDLQVLKKYPYLDRLNCEFRDDLTQLCSQRSIDIDAVYRSNNEHWILDMARRGTGIAVMPEYSLPEDDEDVRTRKLVDPQLSRDVVVLFSSKTQHKNALEPLIACLSD